MALIPVPENPEFSTEMRALEVTDPAYAPTFNSMYQQLLANDEYLKKTADTLVDETTGEKYKIGIENGLPYIEEIVTE